MHFFRPFHFGFHSGHAVASAFVGLVLISLIVAASCAWFGGANARPDKEKSS